MKKLITVTSIPVAAVTTTALVLASETGTGTANSAVTTALQTTANDMLATGNAIVPIALTVIGLSLVVTFGVRLFKRIAR